MKSEQEKRNLIPRPVHWVALLLFLFGSVLSALNSSSPTNEYTLIYLIIIPFLLGAFSYIAWAAICLFVIIYHYIAYGEFIITQKIKKLWR